jgi:Putative adhesin
MTNVHSRTRNALALIATTAAFLALPGCGSSSGKSSAEATFEKTYSVDGPAHLELTIGSGDTVITVGQPGSIHVKGEVSVQSWSTESGQKRANELTANPPISQQGNLVRIGESSGSMNNVSIDYTIEVPPDTALRASNGSGDLEANGIKGPADITLGSGSAKLSSIGSDVQVRAGSGDIEISEVSGQITGNAGSGGVKFSNVKGAVRFETGSGDVEVTNPGNTVELNTGSGNVTVSNATADVRAHTSSGDVDLSGDPGGMNYWDVRTGSGNVTLGVPSSSSLRLYARSGSGDIESDLPLSMEGTNDKHELRAKLGDGKARVEVETSSGSITLK